MKQMTMNETGDRSVFRVPEGYFEGLEAQIGRRIEAFEAEKKLERKAEVRSKGGRILTMQSVRPMLYVAAMFVLLLFSIALVFRYTGGGSGSLRAQETSKEQVVPTAEDYLISSVGTYGISQYYVESQVTE